MMLSSRLQDYLSKAQDFLNGNGTTVQLNDIQSIWVASDNHDAIKQVQLCYSKYFPEIRKESIAWISGESKGNLKRPKVKTHTNSQVS